MLRLRTTTGLSALALAIGIAGTGWLSGRTSAWPDAPRGVAVRHNQPATRPQPPRRHAVVPVVRHRAVAEDFGADTAQAAVITPPPALQPLDTPADPDARWESLRGHLDGHLTVQLRVNGDGRVAQARVLASSGDPILDAHALRSVQGWRFAVPPGHPDGFSGELPMRFSSRNSGVGML